MLRHKEHGDESLDKRPADKSASPAQVQPWFFFFKNAVLLVCKVPECHNVMNRNIRVDSGWEEADQKSAKSVQTEGLDVGLLQTKVRRAFPQTSVRECSTRQSSFCSRCHSWVICKILTMRWNVMISFTLPLLARCNFPRDDHHPFYKPSFSYQRYHHFHPRANFHRREHFHPKPHHVALKEREREKEKERYEQSKSADGSSPPKQSSSKFASAAKHLPDGFLGVQTEILTSQEVRGRFIRTDVAQTKALLNFIERY